MSAYLLFRFTGQGVEFATPVLAVTVHYVLLGVGAVLAVLARRHAVATRRAMRARALSRVGA